MGALPLFNTIKERKLFIIIVFLLFSFNLSLDFNKYKNFTKNEIYQTKGTILNIYHKKNYKILKIKTENFTFFTKYNNQKALLLYDIDLFIVTKDINFISYLKGFYTNSFNVNITKSSNIQKQKIYNYIHNQHENNDIASFYSALFLAIPINENIRMLSSKLGISHLIAISGFHLGIISLVLYFIIHLLYNKIHSKIIPYRNKKFDIMVIITILLFSYLLFINTSASFLRAFVMFVFALFLLRSNIKVISFETLFIISLIIISIFPDLLFSLSLWFSIAGVFYIFLFIQYLHHIHKILQFILFNIWIYLAINPLTHYFFPITTVEQLYSPILSILFTIFYPVSVLLHFLNIGHMMDIGLELFLNLEIKSYEVFTNLWFLIIYIVISLLSIIKKEAFIVLNILLIAYNMWLFHFIF